MKFIEGTEGDISYFVNYKNGMYQVFVEHKNGKKLNKNFQCGYHPICGMDIDDSNKAEEILEELINQINKT